MKTFSAFSKKYGVYLVKLLPYLVPQRSRSGSRLLDIDAAKTLHFCPLWYFQAALLFQVLVTGLTSKLIKMFKFCIVLAILVPHCIAVYSTKVKCPDS